MSKKGKKGLFESNPEWAIVKLAKYLFKLEFSTGPGRVNAAFGFLLVILIIAYTLMDWFATIALAAIGAIKTCILKVNIVEKYETIDPKFFIKAIIIFFIICFFSLIILERNEKRVNKEKEATNEKDDKGD